MKKKKQIPLRHCVDPKELVEACRDKLISGAKIGIVIDSPKQELVLDLLGKLAAEEGIKIEVAIMKGITPETTTLILRNITCLN